MAEFVWAVSIKWEIGTILNCWREPEASPTVGSSSSTVILTLRLFVCSCVKREAFTYSVCLFTQPGAHRVRTVSNILALQTTFQHEHPTVLLSYCPTVLVSICKYESQPLLAPGHRMLRNAIIDNT